METIKMGSRKGTDIEKQKLSLPCLNPAGVKGLSQHTNSQDDFKATVFKTPAECV